MKTIPQGSCPECDTLCREFAHTTAEHIKVIMDSRIASSAREKASDEKRAVAIADAGQTRESVGTAIRKHEALVHKEVASRATAGS